MGVVNGKINFIQLAMVVMLSNGLLSHVFINPMLLDASGRDAWLAVLLAGIIFLPWCVLLVFIMRKSNQQKLLPWLIQRTNKVFAYTIIILVMIKMYLIGGTTVYHTASWTIANYLPNAPRIVLSGLLLTVCFYCASKGMRTLAIASGILLPIVIILGYFVSFANMPNKDYALLFPILENGWEPPLKGMIYAGGGFFELVFILTIQHYVKSKIKIWQMIVFGLITIYITLGPITGSISEFGPDEAAKQFESPYEQWRLVRLGEFIEHVDFLSVYQWLSGACIRISVSMFVLADILHYHSKRIKNLILLVVFTSYILISLLPLNQNTYYLYLYNYYVPYSLIVSGFLSLVFLFIALKKDKPTHKEVIK